MSGFLSSVGSLAQTAFLVLGTLVFAVCVYRWKLHPLSGYPGPILAKLSDLYIIYHVVRGNLHIQQRLLHEKYGPAVRIGPNRLMFLSATALHDIYQSRKVQKSLGYAATDPVPGFSNVFTSIDKSVHRLKRKALSPGFSDQFIRKFENVIIENVDIFVRQLVSALPNGDPDQWSEPQNMSDLCKYFTLDVMGVFGFGRTFNVQKEATNRGIILGMRAGGILSGVYAQMPGLRRLNIHKHFKINGAWTQARHGAFVREMIQERIKLARNAEPDLFSFVSETKDAETGSVFKLDDLWAESRFLLIAGSDTSATVLSGVFFYLSRFPACHQKLFEELTASFKSSSEIVLGQTLSSCQYLRAVIDESMRLAPPVGNALWREVAEASMTVDGHFVPRGAEIGLSLYALFRLAEIYPEPDTFIPERFIEGGRFTDQLQAARAAFKPFSLGSRNCAGMNLAYAEMTLLVAKTVWKLDFKIPAGPQGRVGEGNPDGIPGRRQVKEFQMKALITSLHDGPYLQFKPRE